MKKVSKYFSQDELACKCCGVYKADKRLLTVLDEIREKVGKPVIILSGYRCPKHNAKVGGAPNSKHMLGIACDITVHGMQARQLYAIASEVLKGKGGLGYYPKENFVHVDVREGKARWIKVGSEYKPLTPELEKKILEGKL